MHVENNVCDSLIDTLLNIKGKTKDGLKSHQDLVGMGIQEQLHPISQGWQTYLPPACHRMSTKEKRSYVLMYVNVVYDVYALVLEVQFFYWGLFLSAV